MDHVLIVLAALAVWAVFVRLSPTTPCRCSGRCRRCKGTGQRFRLGARLVHRGAIKAHQEARRRGRKL